MDGWIVVAGIFGVCVVLMSQCSTEKQERNQLAIEQARQDSAKRKEERIKNALKSMCERDREMSRYFLSGVSESVNDDDDYSVFGHEAAQIKAEHQKAKRERMERLVREANVSCN